jgi:hypothetical protein
MPLSVAAAGAGAGSAGAGAGSAGIGAGSAGVVVSAAGGGVSLRSRLQAPNIIVVDNATASISRLFLFIAILQIHVTWMSRSAAGCARKDRACVVNRG